MFARHVVRVAPLLMLLMLVLGAARAANLTAAACQIAAEQLTSQASLNQSSWSGEGGVAASYSEHLWRCLLHQHMHQERQIAPLQATSDSCHHYPASNLNLARLGGPSGKNYFISRKQKMSWMEARSFCRDFGMDLVSIETKQENDLLVKHFQEIGITREVCLWTSGNKIGSWTYMWLNGQPLTFQDWDKGEPQHMDVQQCLCHFNYHWYDCRCERLELFVCEQR